MPIQKRCTGLTPYKTKGVDILVSLTMKILNPMNIIIAKPHPPVGLEPASASHVVGPFGFTTVCAPAHLQGFKQKLGEQQHTRATL